MASGGRRSVLLLAAVAVSVGVMGPVMAQVDGRQALARDLAQLMLTDTLRRELDEQVAVGLTTAVATTLQMRLNRPLQESESRLVTEIVRRFVGDTLVASRTEELAAPSTRGISTRSNCASSSSSRARRPAEKRRGSPR